MNGHTLKGYTSNGLALFRAYPGGTVTFCDCTGTGAIIAKPNPNNSELAGGVADVIDNNTYDGSTLEGGTVNLYGGTLKSENPNGSVITADVHQEYHNDYKAVHINIYGGAVVAQSGQAAIAADRHAILTIAGGSSITGAVYALDMTIGTAGGDRVTINGTLRGATEATTIRSLVNTDIAELQASAASGDTIENCTIDKISGRGNLTIKNSEIKSGTLNIDSNGNPENRDVTIINSNMHDTVVGGKNITITNAPDKNYTVGSIQASEYYIYNTETVERSTVSLSGVTVNGDVSIDSSGSYRASQSSLTLKDTTVTGTVRTAGKADTITVDGAVKGSMTLKDGQQITLGDNFNTSNSQITISCEQPGNIIKNPDKNKALSKVFTSADGKLTFDDKGQVTYANQDTTSHTDGKTYTALVDGGTLTSGHYYLTHDLELTEPIVIPADAEVTLCLHGFELTAKFSMIKNYGKLHLQNCKDFSGKYGSIRYTGTYPYDTLITNYSNGVLDFVNCKDSDSSTGFCRLNIDGGVATAIENNGTFTWNVLRDSDRHGSITSAGPKTIYNTNTGTLTINGPGVMKNTSTNSTATALLNNGTVNLNYLSSEAFFNQRKSYPTIAAEGAGAAIVTTAPMTICSPVTGMGESTAALIVSEGGNVVIEENESSAAPKAGSVKNSNGPAVLVRKGGTLTVNGTVTGKGNASSGAIINSGEVRLTGSTLTSSAITAAGGTLNLTDCTSTTSPITITGAAANINGGSYTSGRNIALNAGEGNLTLGGAAKVNNNAQITLAAGKSFAMSDATDALRVNVQVAGTGTVATGVPSTDCVTIMGSYKKVFNSGMVTAENADGQYARRYDL